jgi:hypothetical protein
MAARSKKAKEEAKEQKPQSPAVRVEIRVGGRIRFANDVYDPDLTVADDVVKFNAAVHPTMVDVNPVRPPQLFTEDDPDPRNSDEVVQKVHDGNLAKPDEDEEST